jgi:DNA-binding MarR family transcriptional regulator
MDADVDEQGAREALAEQLVQVLPAFSRWVGSIRNAETPFGRVAYRQVEILYLIRKRRIPTERLSPSFLADLFSVQRSVVTRLLASLETHGFIVRRVDPEDGRSYFIEITAKGIAVSEYIEGIFIQEMLDGIARLGRTQIARLSDDVGLLRQLAIDLEEMRKERLARLEGDGLHAFDDEPL